MRRAAPGGRGRRARAIGARGAAFVVVSAVAALASLTACGREAGAVADPAERRLGELERMAFVPAGAARPDGRDPLFGASVDLLADLYEATRADWRAYHGGALPPGGPAGDARESWPVTCTRAEARSFAERRGMRLPTAREWLYVAAGPRAQHYPWGRQFQSSVANTLELGLRRPTAVGTFENGRGPFGCYDLLGNVWEWVDGYVPAYGAVDRPPPPGEPWGYDLALGGSFLSRARRLFGQDPLSIAPGGTAFLALALPPGARPYDVGVRCVADAAVYLGEHADELAQPADARPRLVALGARWGPRAAPLLGGLIDALGPLPALEWLLDGTGR